MLSSVSSAKLQVQSEGLSSQDVTGDSWLNLLCSASALRRAQVENPKETMISCNGQVQTAVKLEDKSLVQVA